MRKNMLTIMTLVLVTCLWSGYALAQAKYPTKPIEAICGYAPGGSGDIIARLMADFLSKYFGQPVVVINKVGGAGSVAGNALISAKADGYTIGMFASPQATPECMLNPERFTYTSKDIQPVAQWSGFIPTLAVRYDAPWKTAAELVDYAKKNPDTLRWGHPGRGNFWCILGHLFNRYAGIKMMDVPFDADAQVVTALVGNHIELGMITAGTTAIPQIEAKKIRLLFMATSKRFPLMPDVPTVQEAGYPIEAPDAYLGTMVKAGTPKEIVAQLAEALKKGTEDPQFQAGMKKIWFPVTYRGTDEFDSYVKNVVGAQFLCKYSQMF